MFDCAGRTPGQARKSPLGFDLLLDFFVSGRFVVERFAGNIVTIGAPRTSTGWRKPKGAARFLPIIGYGSPASFEITACMICLQGAPRQQCAENQIGDNGFPQGAGRLVAPRLGDVVGDHDAAGQRHPEPEPEHPCSLLKGKVAAAGSQHLIQPRVPGSASSQVRMCTFKARRSGRAFSCAALMWINRQKNEPQPLEQQGSEWENTKRKGRCQCHASGDGQGQGQNYGYLFHGSLPFSAMSRLPEQARTSVIAITFWSFSRAKPARLPLAR